MARAYGGVEIWRYAELVRGDASLNLTGSGIPSIVCGESTTSICCGHAICKKFWHVRVAGHTMNQPDLFSSTSGTVGGLAVQSILEGFKSHYARDQETELSLEEYLSLAKQDPMAYASPAERMLAAIGEPELIDTRNDPRLSRLFSNRLVRRYPAFKEFY